MRRIKKARIEHISLLARAATQLPVLYKGQEQHAVFDTLLKDEALEERGELTSVIYAPELRDYHGDIASAEVIKDMAYEYAKSGKGLDVQHNLETLTDEQAFVAESFIIQKGDSRFVDMKDYSGNPVDVTGGWAMVIKIEDPELRRLYREGKWNGVSMQGPAEVEPEVQKAERIIEELAKRLGLTQGEDLDMDETKLAAMLKEQNAPVIEAIGKLAEALTPKTEKVAKAEEQGTPDDPLAFTGDPSKLEDVKAHATKVAKAELLKTVDFSDPAALNALIEKLEKAPKPDDSEANEDVSKSEELKKAEAELEKAQAQLKKAKSGSNVPAETHASQVVGLSKEEQDGFAVGSLMAKYINASR